MRYERIENLVRLAVRLQGTPGGLTLDEIQADFSVSRSTAERMRNAVEAAFGPLELVDTDDPKRRWRLRSDAVRRLVAIAPEELAELESAASSLERVGLEERAGTLREFATRVRAILRTKSLARIESELAALVQAEGLAMHAGPRPRLDTGLLSALREAITTRRWVDSGTSRRRRDGEAASGSGPWGSSTETARSSSRRANGRRSRGSGALPT